MTSELRIDLAALDHNVEVMAAWARERHFEIAPHIKTTMTREIVERQINAGAWGVTVATAEQAAIAAGWGRHRILIANEVIDAADLAVLRGLVEGDARLWLGILADSITGVHRSARAMSGSGSALRVLVDVGAPGRRTGVRDAAAAREIAEAVAASDGLRLAGVSGYEGVVPNERSAGTIEAVDAHCSMTAELFRDLAPLYETHEPIFSMGGSAFPDRVAAHSPSAGEVPGVIRLLRSGCYVTHDHGTYAGVSPVPGLEPALSVRATVVSAPEVGLAVIGAGKRELPYDAGLPVLLGAERDRADVEATGTATAIYDHHLVITGSTGLAVGDVVTLGISHPCSAFDRWREIAVLGADGARVETWRPEFH